MEQFSLDKWLKDKSRKLVTRDGRAARIICWDAKNSRPIVALVLTRSISQRGFDELTVDYFDNGTYYGGGVNEDFLDLFFADEEPETEPETIEVPFGAKDSEFIKDEYFIPEGCEARIDGNKVIIKRVQKEELAEFDQEEELTEFEQELRYWIGQSLCNYENNGCVSDNMSDSVNIYLKAASKKLIDLARKELEKDYCIMEPFDVSVLKKEQRELGLKVQKDQENIELAEEPDLDKAAKEHAANLYGEDWMKNEHVQDNGFKAISNFKFGAEWHNSQMKETIQSEYEKGLFDMREEMLKNTVLETKVMKDSDGDGIETSYEEWLTLENTEIPYIPNSLGLKEGDNVKIIIVKED